MSFIYEPKGRAREYAPLACNLYTGCNHGCKYCYVASIFYKTREEWGAKVEPRRNAISQFEKDCRKFVSSEKPVHFSFTTDPYNCLESELRLTREALKTCLKYKIPVTILTKSKTCLKDIDLYKKFGESIKIGFTLTFHDFKKSKEWEPNASTPKERLEALMKLKTEGIKTWASFEPVIEPEESIELIKNTLKDNSVDLYKIGKINNYKGLDKNIDWKQFVKNVRAIFKGIKKTVYYKKDLIESIGEVYNTNSDDYEIVKPFL